MEILNFRKNSIIYYSYILLFIVVLFYGLYHARNFLIPVSLAALFSMLLWPVSQFLERKGLSRAGGAGVCVIILLTILLTFLFFFASQVASFSSEMSNLSGQITNITDKANDFLQSNLGINTENLFSSQNSGTGSGAESVAGSTSGNASEASGDSTTSGTPSVATDTGGWMQPLSSFVSTILSNLKNIAVFTFKSIIGIIVILVYVFLMLLYRHIFLNFIQKISAKKEESKNVTKQIAKVNQQYLAGRLIVIAIVAVINSVGLTLIGIKQGIFFGVLAAVLDLIPYIGIIIGAGLPLIVSIVTKQAWWPVLAVLGLFVFVQLFENYFLTPKVVGSKVRLSPLFTLMAVLVGGYLWGIAGMILFIPFLAMLKIVFDHVEPLHPYGYLVGDPDNRTKKV